MDERPLVETLQQTVVRVRSALRASREENARLRARIAELEQHVQQLSDDLGEELRNRPDSAPPASVAAVVADDGDAEVLRRFADADPDDLACEHGEHEQCNAWGSRLDMAHDAAGRATIIPRSALERLAQRAQSAKGPGSTRIRGFGEDLAKLLEESE